MTFDECIVAAAVILRDAIEELDTKRLAEQIARAA